VSSNLNVGFSFNVIQVSYLYDEPINFKIIKQVIFVISVNLYDDAIEIPGLKIFLIENKIFVGS